jgi:hypothetical protein
MGTTIMKEASNVDYYIAWSSIVEAPLFGGTREETLAYLWETDHRKPEYILEADPSHPETRLKRVDECGTSALWKVAGHPVEGSWEDTDGLIYEQRGTVPRANLFVLTRRLGEDEAADLTDLIEPFEDDDDEAAK